MTGNGKVLQTGKTNIVQDGACCLAFMVVCGDRLDLLDLGLIRGRVALLE